MNKSVLVISYYFPPVGGGGVQRVAKFVKYLPKFDWNPIVITAKSSSRRNTGLFIDPSLLKDIPKDVLVKRTKSIDLTPVARKIKKSTKERTSRFWKARRIKEQIGDLFVNPDPQAFWIPIAVIEGIKLIRKFHISLIFSTAAPWSNHVTGMLLSLLTRKPFIADYRDGWTVSPYHVYSTRLRKRIHFFLENKVIQNASRIIYATEGMEKEYSAVFEKNYQKSTVIRNGFDPPDFAYSRKRPNQNLTFTYCGNIYSYRSPRFFLIALSNWLTKNPKLKKEVKVNFVGKVDEETRMLVEKLGLERIVNIRGYVTHRSSISFLMGTDVLLLIINEVGKSILTGKIFEYLGSGKPILAMIPPDGEAASLLKRVKRDEFIVPAEDADSIQQTIDCIYKKFKSNQLTCKHSENLYNYTREYEAKKLSALMDSIF